MHHLLLLLLLSCLPSCVAAIGNRGAAPPIPPESALPLVQAKVGSAQRIMELHQRQLDEARSLHDSGRATALECGRLEIDVELARLRLLDLQIELATLERHRMK